MKSLNKALDILNVFLKVHNKELKLSEIARLANLNKATVNRVVSVLLARGYLSQAQKRGKYSLGPQFLYFSGVIKQSATIRDTAMPYLVKLQELVEETVILASFDGKRAFIVEGIHPKHHALRIIPDEGSVTPLYCSSMGKIFLASMTEPELEEYFKNTNVEPYTPNTLSDINLLRRHLMVIAKEDVAYDDEELIVGVRSLAVGIKDPEGKITSCVGIMGPSVRMTRAKMVGLVPDIKLCAAEISQALGYQDKDREQDEYSSPLPLQ